MGFMFGNVCFGDGARATILVGFNELSESVKVTMGPKGRNVIIETKGNPNCHSSQKH